MCLPVLILSDVVAVGLNKTAGELFRHPGRVLPRRLPLRNSKAALFTLPAIASGARPMTLCDCEFERPLQWQRFSNTATIAVPPGHHRSGAGQQQRGPTPTR